MCLLSNTLSRLVIAFLPKQSSSDSWLQSPTADFGAQEGEICHHFHISPSICHAVMRLEAMILVFKIFSLKLAHSLSSFTLSKKLFSSSSHSAIRVLSSTYLRLLMFLLPILLPACNSSSPGFLMMCSEYRLNKHGDGRQSCRNLFSILNQSVAPYRVVTFCS